MRGFKGSDIPERSGIQTFDDPYTGEMLYAIPALAPDWAIIHVQEANANGDARILGPRYFDVEMTQAAKGVIITAEKIVPDEVFIDEPEMTAVPGSMVSAVVEAPGGAAPCSCAHTYGVDEAGMRRYMELSTTAEGLKTYLEAEDANLAPEPLG